MNEDRAWFRTQDHAGHGVVVAVTAAGPEVAVTANLRRLAAREAAWSAVKVWPETLPTPRTDPSSDRRRTRDVRRVPRADTGPVRVVLLRYAGGEADLVVVAHRARLGRRALVRLARLLAGAEPVPATGPVPVPAPPVPGRADRSVPPDRAALGFGLPERTRPGRYGRVDLGAIETRHPDAGPLVAALAVAHARYSAGEPVRIGLVDCVRDTVTVAEMAVAEDDTIASARGKAVARQPVAGRTPALGIVFTAPEPDVVYEPAPHPLFAVSLHCETRPDGTSAAHLLFDESWLSPAVATCFARHVVRAVALMSCLPDSTPIAELDLMTTEEIADVLAVGSTPGTTSPTGTIDTAFRAVARKQPDHVACVDGVEQVTYRELDERADRLAAALREVGCGPGLRVGVCLDRGVEAVGVLLAVLRTGAAYVPMDSRAPADRLSTIVADAELIAVVTDVAEFPRDTAVPVLPPSALTTGTSAPPRDAGPDDTAYVIYTSGSTGRPKGVLVPHRNVLALLAATAPDMTPGPDDVWTHFHSTAFDFSVWEIWGCLLTGGRLVCVPYWVARSPAEFHALLVDQRVTVLSQTPSAFTQLIAADAESGRADELAVRLVVFGGESLDVSILRRWFERHPHTRCRLVNMYGITETTVHVTAQTVTPVEVAARTRSVGAALPGWSVSVRDRRGRPLPFGACGEVYVGGAGVADGYLNRPELTAERFLPDPWGDGMLYRTGDRGRLRPDGRLDHLGRVDNQIQLRGYRIELDEIRLVLQELPGVATAVVVPNPGPDGDPAGARLDSYVVLDGAVTAAEIRGHAAAKLPEYMVPSTVTAVAELPLTVNGKVDLAALPAPGRPSREDGPSGVDGQDGPVATLLRIWTAAFGTEVGPEDDFFELGGNSLIAARLVAEQRAAGLPPISMRELYRRPTIATLTASLPQQGVRS